MIHTANEGSAPKSVLDEDVRPRSSASSAGISLTTSDYESAMSSRPSSSSTSSPASLSIGLSLPRIEQPNFEAMVAGATASNSSSSSSNPLVSALQSALTMSEQMPPPPHSSSPSTSQPLHAGLSSASLGAELCPQAEPLPSKRGEIGFREDLHRERPRSARIAEPLPERHPADRSPPTPTIVVTAAEARNDTLPPTSLGYASSMAKKKGILGFFTPRRIPTYGGLRLTTLLIFFGQICLIAATLAVWVITVKKVKPGANQTGPQLQGTSSFIFVHVVFAIATLGQLLFLERRIFRLRAERYMYLHPGSVLPTSYHGMAGSIDPAIIAISPWNRPPLPTYAAALQQSGAGTGDIEDHLIAAPPPPAYGNTRGSTLLLSGFMRESLRAQRPASLHSQSSIHPSAAHGGRPVSSTSRDEQWEEFCDAERARRLEETLARLERPLSQTSRRSELRR